MKRFNFLIAAMFFPVFALMAQDTQLLKSNADGTLDISRIGKDGLKYNLSMSDSIPTINSLVIPHLTLFAGPPAGIHSTIALEDTRLCCQHDSLRVVIGVLDNNGPLHHTIKISDNDFCLWSKERDLTTGEYHISSSGISFNYEDKLTHSGWLLSNKGGKPGQVLTLNAYGNVASWSNVNSFSTVYYFVPTSGSVVNVAAGSNIIEPVVAINTLFIALPPKPGNGTIVAFSFAKPVTTIVYRGGTLATATTTAVAGTTFKYIYYADKDKWYNW